MIVVGTTLAAFVMDQEDTWAAWMRNAEALQASHPEVKYFVAIQVDKRGLEPFQPLLDRLSQIGGEYWTYSLDDGRTSVTTANRLRHITLGQNIVVDYAQSHPNCSHLLFLAADCMPSDDVIPRMLEMNYPLTAPFIPTYGLKGPAVEGYPYPVMDAMASAAAIFIAREVFTKIRWRWDFDTQMSDDPCYHHDAKTLLGIPTHVRRDVLAKHYPEAIGAIETRGHDMTVVRD
jgi:hypothetical protein